MNPQEHEFEAAPGLPEPLPPGERLLWQGAPDWRVLAVEALHLRKVALYFALLLAWRLASSWSDGATLPATLVSTLPLLSLALLACGLLAGLAWTMARTTLYTLTDKRVVMRVGVALSVSFNLPFKAIEAAALRERGDGHGDISLVLAGPDRIAYLHLWPHVRPWQLRRPQPMLRALRDARPVAQLFADALARSAGVVPQPVAQPQVAPVKPVEQATPARPMAHA